VRSALRAVEVGALRGGHGAGASHARERSVAPLACAARLPGPSARWVRHRAATAAAAQPRRALARRRAADLTFTPARLAATAHAHRPRAALVTRAARPAFPTAVRLRQHAGSTLTQKVAAALRAPATRGALQRTARASDAVRSTATVLRLLARSAGSTPVERAVAAETRPPHGELAALHTLAARLRAGPLRRGAHRRIAIVAIDGHPHIVPIDVDEATDAFFAGESLHASRGTIAGHGGAGVPTHAAPDIDLPADAAVSAPCRRDHHGENPAAYTRDELGWHTRQRSTGVRGLPTRDDRDATKPHGHRPVGHGGRNARAARGEWTEVQVRARLGPDPQPQRPALQVPEQQSRSSRQPRPAARQAQRPETQSM
jgi:hypothetical protein